MANVVNTNVMSINSQRSLAKTEMGLQTAMQRLSSGLRINSAKDDSAGLAISERFKAQAGGMEVAIRNASDGISFAQTAEGAMQEAGDMLQRMRDLAVQSANGINTASDRSNLNAEFQALAAEISRTFSATEFNGIKMLSDDSLTAGRVFQVGANNGEQYRISVSTSNMNTDAKMAAATGTSITTSALAQGAIDLIDSAIDRVTTERSKMGAIMNRFEHTISNLRNSHENTEASRSRITDADFAKESANLSRQQVLQQASTAMLAQANQAPQSVMSLIR